MAMSSDPVMLSLIAASVAICSSVVAPLILSWMNNRNSRLLKIEDYKRQDDVEFRSIERAATAARLAQELIETQAVTASAAKDATKLVAAKLDESNKAIANTAAQTQGQLSAIHTLVNSNMTAAMQAQYDATARELAMMQEVIELKKAAGHQPNIDTLAMVEATQKKIADLGTQIADRLTAATAVANQAKPEQK